MSQTCDADKLLTGVDDCLLLNAEFWRKLDGMKRDGEGEGASDLRELKSLAGLIILYGQDGWIGMAVPNLVCFNLDLID